jgi:hypothetical protein
MRRLRNRGWQAGPYVLPSERAILRAGHPLLVGLKSAWLATEFKHNHYGSPGAAGWLNLAPENGVAALVNINTSVSPNLFTEGEIGPAVDHANGAIWGASTAFRPLAAGGYTPFTIAWVGRLTALSNLATGTFYGFSGGTPGYPHFAISATRNGSIYDLFGDVRMTSGSGAVLTLANFCTPLQTLAVILTSRSATDHEILAVNLSTGAIVSLGLAVSAGTATSEANTENIGALTDTFVSNRVNGIAHGAFAWNRGFTSQEMAAWIGAPWDMLAPRQQRFRSAAYARSAFAFTTPVRVSRAGVEMWSNNVPPLAVSQVGLEAWYSLIPALAVTRTGLEVWLDHASLISDTPPATRRRRLFLAS